MYDGSLKSLEQVVDFYDRGGGANPALDSKIESLGLTDAEKAARIAFLKALRFPGRPRGEWPQSLSDDFIRDYRVFLA